MPTPSTRALTVGLAAAHLGLALALLLHALPRTLGRGA